MYQDWFNINFFLIFRRTIEKLREVLNNGKGNKVTKQNPAIVPASKKVSDFLKDISASSAQVCKLYLICLFC